MAVTITRSIWVDDDGSGTTGTVINQALHTTLYNEIDTALAKVAQLAGGNALTGNQAVTGTLTVSGQIFGGIPLLGNMYAGLGANAVTYTAILFLQNLDAGNTGSFVMFANSAVGVAGSISQASATTVAYNTTSDARLKDDDGRADDLTALRAVVVHDFTWKADGTRARGIFAQEAAPVFPHAITAGTDERTAMGTLARPWMTDYSKFVPDLIVGWQQHDAELAALRALVTAR